VSDPLLSVEDLTVNFDTEDGLVHAVDGVSFDVARGKVLGIVGESGSGKSVSCMSIMGLTAGKSTRISGRVSFEGRDLLTAPDADVRKVRGSEIAMIFQDPLSSLHPFYTIGRQLVEAVRAHHPEVSRKAAKERAIEMLGLVGIPDPRGRVNSYPHEFSGGMRQRVMIAMALVNEPKLLIADEPTTALDVTVQAQILALMKRLNEELEMAMILITHDLGVVAEIADEVAVMYAGQIVEKATPETLFAAPEHPYTWGLLRSIPRLDTPRDQELVPVAGRPPSLINRPSGCHFHPRCPYVREAHTREEPQLVPVAPGEDDHLVRCLLPHETRLQLWKSLNAGEDPAAAAAAAGTTVTEVKG
jgi:peptide/nickel transport system ATP-binding protein